ALLMHAWHPSLIFFFFQAEDGIRDRNVTGVQTCALPISRGPPRVLAAFSGDAPSAPRSTPTTLTRVTLHVAPATDADVDEIADQIGRASCRERVESAGVAVAGKKKKEEEAARNVWQRRLK